MKKIFLLGLILTSTVLAQTTTSAPSTTSTRTTGLPGTSPTTAPPATTPAQKAPPKDEGPLIKVPSKVSASATISYLSPGVIVNRVTSWQGGDNLLNLSKNIPVRVELVLPIGKKSPIEEAVIKKHVVDIFAKAGISDKVQAYADKPPLPFFHVLVMAQQIDKGYAVYVAGRLFEQVDVSRVVLNNEAFFQAVTWEKQELIVASPEEIANQVLLVLDEIATNFADRYTYYENIKKDMK